MSIKFPPVILGPEMAAPILWAPGILGLCLLENPHAHKIPPFRGGSWVFWKGGVEVPILFLWAWGFFRFFTTEATIKIDHFRKGAHSNGNTCFGQQVLMAETATSDNCNETTLGRSEEKLQKLNLNPLLDGS